MKLKRVRNSPPEKKPRLCFVGNMLGANAGYITTQGQIVADLFTAEHFEVTRVSSRVNRAARLAEIITVLVKKRRRFDVVVLDVYSGLNLIMAETVGWLCNLLKLPLIMVLRGGDLPKFVERKPEAMRKILGRADLLVAPSAFLADKIGRAGFEVEVVSNVLDLKRYAFRRRRALTPKLFWMRSFHPVYNPQLAVRVLAGLKARYPAATLTMAGVDKGLEAATKKLAEDLGLREAVRFPGFLDREQKAKEFARHDIFLNTNRVDNMPVAIVEAAASGLPVVATRVGGIPYLLTDGENALLVPDEDADAMTRAVRELLEKPPLAQRLAAGGRRLARRSAWKQVRGEWEKLFVRAAREKQYDFFMPKIKAIFSIDKT